MDGGGVGQKGNCGSVMMLKTVKNPVKLARLVMQETQWCTLSGVNDSSLTNYKGNVTI